ncbi:hypothetical protein BMR1_02g01265 [Babesia microti strain RI]|uniref:Uncharacterized protein n=1 Tax=Babesia microti (strain RI) TaxID=1133968 RepID=I7IG70_BABMR|nr:hypothetical protein BMR1_02g01265 [Babesia microti strain RI]CCF73416.1 hypothetical protein BMR1_02g01265 [Babesia microti strain RI]|eukprot:XP_012648025.1 hypothetical protein BMR1_02g01265 [Babesia microti strain RI]
MELYKLILLGIIVNNTYCRLNDKRLEESFSSNGDKDLENFLSEFGNGDEGEDDEDDLENIISEWSNEPIDINLLQITNNDAYTGVSKMKKDGYGNTDGFKDWKSKFVVEMTKGKKLGSGKKDYNLSKGKEVKQKGEYKF